MTNLREHYNANVTFGSKTHAARFLDDGRIVTPCGAGRNNVRGIAATARRVDADITCVVCVRKLGAQGTTVTLPPISEDTAREAARMSRTWREVPAISDAVARHYLDGFRWLDVNDHATLTALDAVRGVPDDQPTTVTTQDVRVVLDVIRANDGRLSTWGREAASALLSWVVAHEAAPNPDLWCATLRDEHMWRNDRCTACGRERTTVTAETPIMIPSDVPPGVDPAEYMALEIQADNPFDGAPLIDGQAPTTTDTPHEAIPCPSCGVERGNHPASGCPPHGDLRARPDANTGAALDSEDPARVPAWWQPGQDAPRNPMPALRFAPPTTPPIVVVEGEDLDMLRFRVGAYDLATVRTVRVAVSASGLMVDMGSGWWAPIGRPANDRGW